MGKSSVTLKQFQERRDVWLKCVSGDDRNSIDYQLHDLTWDAAAFRVVNEALRLAPTARGGGVKWNGLVGDLITRCFFASQLAGVRRLTDKGGIFGKEGVCSLAALLRDMASVAHLMTRQNIFLAEGLEYNFEAMEKQYYEHAMRQMQQGRRSTRNNPVSETWRYAEMRHKQIDQLSGVDPKSRSPEDAIPKAVFTQLEAKVERACGPIPEYVNKFIAHAATPESRLAANADKLGVNLARLWRAHRALSEVASFVNVYILGASSIGGLGVPLYNQFAYIDRPLVSRDNIDKLREVWRKHQAEAEKWRNWDIDALLRQWVEPAP